MKSTLGLRHVVLPVAVGACLAAGCAANPRPADSATGAAASGSRTVDGSGKTLAELFEGKFAGVSVTRVQGGVKLKIRNAQNFDESGGDPLYVIDNVPISPPDNILTIDPNDVLKIEILKDDASTMIWGQRGANGVVKITTKRK
jgi:TonB-dependent SusC/RagA subfamily outer membrane receptor